MRAAFLSLFLASCACAPRGHVDGVPDVRDQVGLLTVSDDLGNRVGTCSAWIVSEEVVLAAHHCMRPDATFLYGDLPAEPMGYPRGPDDPDLALWRVPGLDGHPMVISDHDPIFGADVYTVGYPHGVLMPVRGQWAGRRGQHGVLAMTEYYGASGSAVLCDGRVIGVLVAISSDYTGLTYVVPVDELRGFLFEHRIAFDGGTDSQTGN